MTFTLVSYTLSLSYLLHACSVPSFVTRGLLFLDMLAERQASDQRHGMWIGNEEYIVRVHRDGKAQGSAVYPLSLSILRSQWVSHLMSAAHGRKWPVEPKSVQTQFLSRFSSMIRCACVLLCFAVGSACQSLLSKQVLTSSPYARLQWPSFQAAVAADVSIDVTHRPNSIEVQVWEAGWIYNSIIARASVPIPGALPLLPLDVPSFRYPCLTLHSVNV